MGSRDVASRIEMAAFRRRDSLPQCQRREGAFTTKIKYSFEFPRLILPDRIIRGQDSGAGSVQNFSCFSPPVVLSFHQRAKL